MYVNGQGVFSPRSCVLTKEGGTVQERRGSWGLSNIGSWVFRAVCICRLLTRSINRMIRGYDPAYFNTTCTKVVRTGPFKLPKFILVNVVDFSVGSNTLQGTLAHPIGHNYDAHALYTLLVSIPSISPFSAVCRSRHTRPLLYVLRPRSHQFASSNFIFYFTPCRDEFMNCKASEKADAKYCLHAIFGWGTRSNVYAWTDRIAH